MTSTETTTQQTPPRPAAERESPAGQDVKLTTGQRWLAGAAALGGVTVSACGYITNFEGLTDYAEKKGWAVPEALPVGLDMAIPTLLAFDYIATVKGARFPFLRWCAWGLTGYTVLAGAIAAAAKGHEVDWGTVALKAIMPVLGVIIVDFVRKWALYKKNLLENKQADSIPFARWVADPFRTLWMKRQMAIWNENSYPRAIVRQAALLYARSLLKSKYGRSSWLRRLNGRGWKHHTPLSLRYRLSRGLLPTSVVDAIKFSVTHDNEDWQPAVERWIVTELWRVRRMFGDRDSDRRLGEVSDQDPNLDRSGSANRDPEIGNRDRRSSGTANGTKRTGRTETRTAGKRSETDGPRRVGRPARSEAEMAQLRTNAAAIFATFLQDEGRVPTADELRKPLKIGKPMALVLLRELKAGSPEVGFPEEAPELALVGGDGHV